MSSYIDKYIKYSINFWSSNFFKILKLLFYQLLQVLSFSWNMSISILHGYVNIYLYKRWSLSYIQAVRIKQTMFELEWKGEREREEEEVSVVACRRAPLGPTILSHMTHWNRTLRDSERRPGVPSSSRHAIASRPNRRLVPRDWHVARNCATVPPRSRPADSPLLPFAFAFVHDHF